MKRKLLTAVLVTVMASSMAACGNNEVSKVDDNTVQIGQNNTNTESDTTVDNTEDVSSEMETENEKEVKLSFLEENSIEITPCGEMVIPLGIANTEEDTQDMNVAVSVDVVPSEEDGYSDTIFTAVIDITNKGGFSMYCTAFDRYTGYDFECSFKYFTNETDTKKDDVCVIDVDGTKYDCTYTSNLEKTDATHYTKTITIHHPSEYDGVVFQFGKLTASMNEVSETIDYSTPFQITKYPELLDGHFFFTATNN